MFELQSKGNTVARHLASPKRLREGKFASCDSLVSDKEKSVDYYEWCPEASI